ncbi:EAL domain-containing protein [Alkalimarinus coralli]|uniref:sensor domain-containing phosphodiesterase n=1 Tax=Alkalimarinus coralli TaxID=2935863 RepID=UPI00202AC859|nr:EAL domain-containing protein [Alkalimarinus coralli]
MAILELSMTLTDSYLRSNSPDIKFQPKGTQSAATAQFHQFTLSSVYQPIVSFTHQRIVGYEALVRASCISEPIQPDGLFALADTFNEGTELDRLCRAIHVANFEQPENPCWLFLNLGSQTINSHQYSAELINKALHQYGLTPDQVVLEIVEHKVRGDIKLSAFVERYKSLGFRIAIDDFGKGESNFDRIWRVAPHIVKLDRSMLLHAEHHKKARGALKGLVSLLRQSGCLVLIEGIETEKQAEIALDAEADMFQGFYFAKPSTTLASNTHMKPLIEEILRRYRQSQCLKEEQSHQLLKALRLEILTACDGLARGLSLDEACTALLDLAPVKRCFILDKTGTQKGKTADIQAVIDDQTLRNCDFNPLIDAEGANWAHREYFQCALNDPNHISISKPYIALPDAASTITFSIHTYTQHGHVVFCIDTSPEELNQDLTNLPQAIGLS